MNQSALMQVLKNFSSKTNAIENQTKWSIDPVHSEIGFRVKHLMISHVKGGFQSFNASIYTNNKDFTSAEVDLWIEADSLSTGDSKRDEHLKSADFLNVEQHRQITFSSSTMGNPDRDGNSELWGALTIAGITKNVKLKAKFGGMVKDPWGKERVGFSVTGTFNRKDWGLVWNSVLEAGGVLVGEEITIACELQLINSGKEYRTMQLEPGYRENQVF